MIELASSTAAEPDLGLVDSSLLMMTHYVVMMTQALTSAVQNHTLVCSVRIQQGCACDAI